MTSPEPLNRQFITAQAVADLLSMPLRTIYDQTKAGRIPGAVRVGQRIRYDVAKLTAWLDAGGHTPEGTSDGEHTS